MELIGLEVKVVVCDYLVMICIDVELFVGVVGCIVDVVVFIV